MLFGKIRCLSWSQISILVCFIVDTDFGELKRKVEGGQDVNQRDQLGGTVLSQGHLAYAGEKYRVVLFRYRKR